MSKDKQDKNNDTAQQTVKNIVPLDQAEKIIAFTLEQEKENNLAVGRKDDDIFICFKDKILQDFFKEWFEMLIPYKKGKMREETYDYAVEGMMKRFEHRETVTVENTTAEDKPELMKIDDDM